MFKCLECKEEFETAKVEYVNRVGHERNVFNVCPSCGHDDIVKFNEETLDDLVEKVREWFIDKNLHTADPNKQMLKLFEELGEVASGMARSDMNEVKDGIGDVLVVLIGLSMQLDTSVTECLEIAYNEIKGRTGKTVNGVFVKEEDLKEK